MADRPQSGNVPQSNLPLTDEELLRVTIGPRKPHNSTIFLAPYDAAWPSIFERQAGRIREVLGETAVLVEHVGSTSVPGLAAKPIIDIVLAVPDSADEPAYVTPLEAHGYVLRIREPDWFEHRCFKASDAQVNLHVFTVGCTEIDRMLLFRDWLRSNDSARQLYEDTKRELAARTWKYTQNYADAKTGVIQEILVRAERRLD